MPETITVVVNGKSVTVPSSATVAVAIAIAGDFSRRSVTGEPRGALCGMGICFECRAIINGQPHCRSCQVACEAGMNVRVDE